MRSDGFGGRENLKLEIRNVELGRYAVECALRAGAFSLSPIPAG
jgi:hypothetical protein